MKDYYIYEYIYDTVKEQYTNHEGEIKGYLRATDVMDAMEKFGATDFQRYDASEVVDLLKHMKAVKEDKKHLNKLEKALKEMITYREAEGKICPNCDIPLNDKGMCDTCDFGHEKELSLKNIVDKLKSNKDKLIADGMFSTEDEYTKYLDEVEKDLKEEIKNNR